MSRTRGLVITLVGALLALGVAATTAAADDTTISYDTLRTGWDTNEPTLSPAAVSASDFGQLFSTQVDGQVYAQPLVANGTLVVATENNNVYGMDPVSGAIRWSMNAGPAWPAATISCGDLVPNIGITGTPVYNPATNAVYFAAKVNDGPDAAHPNWYLHALDATTGAEKAGFPTLIKGSATNDPGVAFSAETEMQRPGLLLLGGVVYAAFGSHCDATPYVGYVVGVNAATGAQTTLWSDEAATADEAGIWQSGGGLVSDGPGRIILATGNGVSPAPGNGDSPPATLGESVVRLAVNTDGSLTAQSFFSPYDNAALNQDDEDLGSGGPMALPASFGTTAHPHLVVTVGKDGRVYLLDADHLGGSAQGADGKDAALSVAGPFNGVWGHPAFWGGDGGYVYTVEANGPVRALKYSATNGNPTLTSVGTSTDNLGYTSGSPVVTSSGSTSGSALVWVEYSSGSDGSGGQLRAYNPVPVNGVLQLVYSAPIGNASKFATPGTDAGRVYVGTRDGRVLSFGRPTTSPLTTTPADFGSVAVGGSTTNTVILTATRTVTISAVDTTGPFAANPAALPVTLTQGQTLGVPVSYKPTTWGSATGDLTFTTGEGTTAFGLHGTGTQPGLGATPATLDYGQVRTGASEELSVNILNIGTTTETITGVTPPSATGPFAATNLPAAGTTLAPGASLVISVAYTPTTGADNGKTDADQLVVTSDAGSVTVPLTGVALTGEPVLTLTPSTLDFGIVPVGQSVTRSFTVTNTGTVPLTITKAKAPSGIYSTADPLSEGQSLQPGDSIQQSVTYTPASAYPATAAYLITGNDGQGEQTVSLTGNMDPIAVYYQELGGSRGSYLSDPVTGEYQTANGGMAQDFRGGSIYWSPATGAHAVHGVILSHYKALGGPASSLGYPTTDETGTPDGIGRYNHFDGGNGLGASIYWTPNTGAWAVQGAIRAEWAATGWELGPLGYPTTDETTTPDGTGRFNHFTGQNTLGGSVYWTAATGAHAVYGAIRAEWAASGWELGPMGYPTTDETGTPDGIGRYNHFAGHNSFGASIYWSPATGAHEVYGAIRAEWASLGWELGRLGYPTSDQFAITGGQRNNFQHGTVSWNSANGAITVVYS
jgi:hypothetical protein